MARASGRPAPQAIEAEGKRPRESEMQGPARSSEEILRDQIAEAAYYRALHRGFAQGFDLDDWLQAELEVRHRPGST